MKRLKKWTAATLIVFSAFSISPRKARADLWGGDVIVLTQILANAVQQLLQLRSILSTGQDTLGLIRDLNNGLSHALSLVQTMNSTLAPGTFAELQNLQQVLRSIEQLYGMIPQTADSRMQTTVDRSVAESIHLHNEAFRYADRVDPEAERIKSYAFSANPKGAARVTAQGIGVLIHVMNQVLRTNAAMLKLQGEQLALANRKEKLGSQQFKTQYEGLSSALTGLNGQYSLPSLSDDSSGN